MLKEKFKNLKMWVKRWNKEEYGDTFKKFKMIEYDLNKLEEISSHRQLSSQEDIKREFTRSSMGSSKCSRIVVAAESKD